MLCSEGIDIGKDPTTKGVSIRRLECICKIPFCYVQINFFCKNKSQHSL